MGEKPEKDITFEHCPICEKHIGPDTYSMLAHLNTHHAKHGPKTPNDVIDAYCFCGHKFGPFYSYSVVSNHDGFIAELRTHIAGRNGAGVTSPRLELSEIHDHYQRFILGITSKEGK